MTVVKGRKLKYLVIDDEMAMSKAYQEDFIADINLPNTIALFAADCEEGLEMIENNSDIHLCFLDCRLPWNAREATDFSPYNNSLTSHGLNLIPQINRLRDKFAIIVFSAYVEKNQLIEQSNSYSNVVEFVEKDGDLSVFGKAFNSGLKWLKMHLNSEIVETELYSLPINSLEETKESGFDYSSLDEGNTNEIRQRADKIKFTLKRTAKDLVDIGRYISEVKDLLPHGYFIPWVEAEIGLSLTSASRFMRVYDTFKKTDLTGVKFIPTAMYILAKGTSAEGIEEVFSLAEKGETITVDLAKSIKKKYPSKKNRAKTAASEDLSSSQAKTDLALPLDRPVVPQSAPLAGEESRSKEKIVKVIPLKRNWLVSDHQLVCCDPNSKEFIDRLPAQVDLVLSYPQSKDWHFNYTNYVTSNTFFCSLKPAADESSSELVYAKDVVNYHLQMKKNLSTFKLKYSKDLILDNTDDRSVVVVCFIPHPQILVLLDKLGCQVYIADPDRLECVELLKQSVSLDTNLTNQI